MIAIYLLLLKLYKRLACLSFSFLFICLFMPIINKGSATSGIHNLKAVSTTYERQLQTKGNNNKSELASLHDQVNELNSLFLQQKNKADKWYFLFMLTLTTSILGIGLMIYFNVKLESKMLAKAKKLVDDDLKNKEVIISQLRKDIDFKKSELINYTLNIIEKNHQLDSIVKSLISFNNLIPSEYSSKLNSIIFYMHSFLNKEKDWLYFKNYFENSNTGFFHNLKNTFPEITHQELKICALSKLNLSLKEIASILGISPESVKVTRSRIKKKLNLTQDEDFIKFLGTQEEESDYSNI
jgi:DNA-binding CsgD family transcriptional regulator